LPTFTNIRKKFVESGLENALYDKPRPGAIPKITGAIEAQLTMLACSAPSEGRTRWTLQLLADNCIFICAGLFRYTVIHNQPSGFTLYIPNVYFDHSPKIVEH